MQVLEVEIARIQVEDRFRKELGNVDELVRSIEEKGLIQPITLSPSLRLLAGGRRLEAHKRLGRTTIPAIIRTVSGEVDEKEVELYENIHRKDLTWQERAKLEKAIYDLKPDNTVRGVAAALGVGKTALSDRIQLAEALAAMPDLGKFKTEDDARKALRRMQERIVVNEITKRAAAQAEQLASDQELPPELAIFREVAEWYRIGDALEGMDGLWSAGVHNRTFDIAEVDPPYGIELQQVKRSDGEVKSTDGYVETPMDTYEEFIHNVASTVYALLKDNSWCIWWFGPTHFNTTITGLRRVGFSVPDVPCIWTKGNQGQTNQPNVNLANCYEMFFLARKGSPVLMKPGRSNVFDFSPVIHTRKIHPTERPVALIEELFATLTVPGTRVLCPFLGSGNTLRAAMKRDMVGVGWDLQPAFRNAFLLRVKEDADGTSEDLDNLGDDELLRDGIS